MLLMRIAAAAASSALLLGASGASAADEPLDVVATFSILGDFVAQVGGDKVKVTTLVGPNGDGHVYEPSPADARATAEADLVVMNGLGFEGWIERLVEAAEYKGPVVVASEGVEPLAVEHAGEEADSHGAEAEHAHEHGSAAERTHEGEAEHDHGAVDPHAWQSLANARIYVENIAEALCAADAADCPTYRANADRYRAELAALDAEIKAGFAEVPPDRRKVVSTHDAFGYFEQAYGIEFLSPQGVSSDAEASAADVARLIEQVREEGVTALFLENVSDPRLTEQIARETGISPGGELYSDALSEADGPAPTYLAMMRHNAGLLQGAMRGS